MDTIHEWLIDVRERLTRVLDDKSFEHDTQAATGSTTGDWFILLYVQKKVMSYTHTIIRLISVRKLMIHTVWFLFGKRHLFSKYSIKDV